MIARFSADFVATRNEHLVWAALCWIGGALIWGAFVLPLVRRAGKNERRTRDARDCAEGGLVDSARMSSADHEFRQRLAAHPFLAGMNSNQLEILADARRLRNGMAITSSFAQVIQREDFT